MRLNKSKGRVSLELSPDQTGQVQDLGAAESRRINKFALASFVLSCVAFGPGSLLAVIFGIIARKQIKRSGIDWYGKGLATWGLVLGIIGLVGLALLGAVLVLIHYSTWNYA
jgi:hypothetical protein